MVVVVYHTTPAETPPPMPHVPVMSVRHSNAVTINDGWGQGPCISRLSSTVWVSPISPVPPVHPAVPLRLAADVAHPPQSQRRRVEALHGPCGKKYVWSALAAAERIEGGAEGGASRALLCRHGGGGRQRRAVRLRVSATADEGQLSSRPCALDS